MGPPPAVLAVALKAYNIGKQISSAINGPTSPLEDSRARVQQQIATGCADLIRKEPNSANAAKCREFLGTLEVTTASPAIVPGTQPGASPLLSTTALGLPAASFDTTTIVILAVAAGAFYFFVLRK